MSAAPLDLEERRLDDAQGAAALRLERVRKLSLTGWASAADVISARNALSAAWAALDLYRSDRTTRSPHAPTG